MPVITRSQYKNIITFENKFFNKIKLLLDQWNLTLSREKQMQVALELFKLVNKDLSQICAQSQNKSWKKFACTIIDKIKQFNHEYSSGKWKEIDENLVYKFIEELCKARKITLEIIVNYSVEDKNFITAKNELIYSVRIRPRRIIPRVNYTGMA